MEEFTWWLVGTVWLVVFAVFTWMNVVDIIADQPLSRAAEIERFNARAFHEDEAGDA